MFKFATLLPIFLSWHIIRPVCLSMLLSLTADEENIDPIPVQCHDVALRCFRGRLFRDYAETEKDLDIEENNANKNWGC